MVSRKVGKVCATCWGAYIVQRSHTHRYLYCSRACSDAKPWHLSTCVHCGEEFRPKHSNHTTCCSRECGHAYQKGAQHDPRRAHTLWMRALRGDTRRRVCYVCYGHHATKGKTCGATSCKAIWNRYKTRETWERNYQRAAYDCKECGKRVVPAAGDGAWAYCSDTCKRRAQVRSAHAHGRNHRQRARHHGVPYTYFPVARIYERDGWSCGICGGLIDRTAKAPHPHSRSLDHIVPLYAGPGSPGHIEANVQAAHFMCNSMKGAQVDAA